MNKELYLVITPEDEAVLYRATAQQIHESNFPVKKIFAIETDFLNSFKVEGNKLSIDLGTIVVRELQEGGYTPMKEEEL